MGWHNVFAICSLCLAGYSTAQSGNELDAPCQPIFVRWPRVKLTFRPRVEGPYAQQQCRDACSGDQHPARNEFSLSCAGYNQRQDHTHQQHDCQIYQADQLQNVDGNAEADDRYSFYWKYCVKSKAQCKADYQFTFFTDRYMDRAEVAKVVYTSTLEQCLAKCLDEEGFACRSVSFNRTDGACHLSAQNQLSKPKYIRLNNNPNFRIDYYESNCFNNSFTFEHECHRDGILVKVQSQLAYTGALYGLYDYFTCRIEPQAARDFQLFFPTPTVSRNCSDSIRERNGDLILEVVLSTDGVEPLYFITPEDLTYQARCHKSELSASSNYITTAEDNDDVIKFVPLATSTDRTSSRPEKDDELKSSQLDQRSALLRMETQLNVPTRSSVASATTARYRQIVDVNSEIVDVPSEIVDVASDFVDVSPELVGVNATARRGSKISVHYKLPFFGDSSFAAGSSGQRRMQRYRRPARPVRLVEPEYLGRANSTSSKGGRNLDGSRIIIHYRVPGFDGSREAADEFNADSPDENQSRRVRPPSTTERSTTSRRISVLEGDASTEGAKTLYITVPTLPPRSRRIDGGGERIRSGPIDIDTTTTRRTTTSTSTTVTSEAPPTRPPTLPPRTTKSPTTTSTTRRNTPSSSSTSTSSSTSSSSTTTTNAAPSSSTANSSSQVSTTTTTTTAAPPPTTTQPPRPILFDIFNGGTPVQAVVVGTKVTLSFTPHFAIPPSYMTIAGCQVEPIDNEYDWEREPLPIIKDGCQSDSVGLVCPPERTDFGIRTKVEAFRYQSTAQVQYTCLVRVCPFAPCPQVFCPPVEGCASNPLINRQQFSARRQLRQRRQVGSFVQAPASGGGSFRQQAANNNPTNFLFGNNQNQQQPAPQPAGANNQQQRGFNPTAGFNPASAAQLNPLLLAAMAQRQRLPNPTQLNHNRNQNGGDQVLMHRPPPALQENLIALGGDHVVKKRLIVLNSENELQYYLRTGSVPQSRLGQSYFGGR